MARIYYVEDAGFSDLDPYVSAEFAVDTLALGVSEDELRGHLLTEAEVLLRYPGALEAWKAGDDSLAQEFARRQVVTDAMYEAHEKATEGGASFKEIEAELAAALRS